MANELPHEPAAAYAPGQPQQQGAQPSTYGQNDAANATKSSYPAVPSGGPAPVQATMHSYDNPGMVVPLEQLQQYPEWVDCPYCGRRGKTQVLQSDSWVTFLAGAGLCLICICLAPIPCIAKWCQDVVHQCSNCHRNLVSLPYDGGKTIYAEPQPAMGSNGQPVQLQETAPRKA